MVQSAWLGSVVRRPNMFYRDCGGEMVEELAYGNTFSKPLAESPCCSVGVMPVLGLIESPAKSSLTCLY